MPDARVIVSLAEFVARRDRRQRVMEELERQADDAADGVEPPRVPEAPHDSRPEPLSFPKP
jgi:hypothetical protein